MFGCLPFVKPCGKQVDQIDRRHAKLEQIPDEVLRSFRTLEECRLDANQIKELPKVNFFRLERIRYLTLSDNDLTEIPAGLGKFSHLVELDISRNDISTIPNSIRFCDSLQTVDISNNPLQR
ncbi:Leucine Rich repeat-containing domain protein [Paragonimus heterotremus]|uniref:Leucine Rich repeat-containing domain protein n=1 Tax=Paragonimus heterotremus TaxID=100268 RepID=A0A8J4WKW5_9TREM|nr:Leucine Rich repeat-containing domain protein [Paragonimus heterotremus]